MLISDSLIIQILIDFSPTLKGVYKNILKQALQIVYMDDTYR